MTTTAITERIPGARALREAAAGGDPSVTVALLDSDIDLRHPCFGGADIGCLSIETDAPFGHDSPGAAQGTHVASLLCGQPDSGVTGLAPRCRIIGLPVYAEDARGQPVACHQPMLGRAIRRAAEAGADIITISGAPMAQPGPVDRFFDDAIRLCAKHDILIVAAAGNDGCRCEQVPAARACVLPVAGHDAAGRPLPFPAPATPYWSRRLLAPADAVPGAAPGGGVVQRQGTPAAAPLVSGAAALLLTLQIRHHAYTDLNAIRRLLLESAETCPAAAMRHAPRTLAGRLNAHRALAALAATGPAAASADDSPYHGPGPAPADAPVRLMDGTNFVMPRSPQNDSQTPRNG